MEYKVVITGGGPAGIMLGYLMARAGIEVAVLEKHKDFLRDFRGDTIHPSTMTILDELGILEDFLQLPFNKTTKVTAQIGDKVITIADFQYLNCKTPFIAFTPQWHFLNFIAGKAAKLPGFNLMMETEARDIIEEYGIVKGVRAVNKQGEEFDIRGAVVIAADGRQSVLRKKAGLTVKRLATPLDVLWFRLEKNGNAEEKPFGIIKHEKILIMIDRGDYWQCALNIKKGGFIEIKDKGLDNFKKLLAEILPFASESTEAISSWEEVKLLSVAVDRLRRWYRPGLLCIGDAAHAMSPIGGVGINLAIQDSVAAANILVLAFRKGIPTVTDFARLQKRRMLPTRITQYFQELLQNKILTPYIDAGKEEPDVPAILKLFNKFPLLRWLPARFIGIGIRSEHIKTKAVSTG